MTYDYARAALWDTKFSLQSRPMTSPDHLAILHGPELEDLISCLDKNLIKAAMPCSCSPKPRRCEVVFLNMYKGEQTLYYALASETVRLFSPILKWYYDQKIISFFSSDFESVFA